MKTMLAALAALPLGVGVRAAIATPLYVQYDGTVSAVDYCADCEKDYKVGDAIHGYVRIEADLAPPDGDPEPGHALYGDFDYGPGPDFVHAPPIPRGLASDYVSVRDEGAAWVGPGRDAFAVENVYAYGTTNVQALVIFAATGSPSFLHGTDILQSFDITKENPPDGEDVDFFGLLVRGTGKAYREVYFALTRVSGTVGQCRP
jgi:hypothetical protein